MAEFTSNPEHLEAFTWLHCRGPGFLELPVSEFHRELMWLTTEPAVAVAAPRFFAKSTTFAKFYASYAMLEGAQEIMLISATGDLSEEHLSSVKQIIERKSIIKRFGPQRDDKLWRNDQIRLKNGARLIAKGAGKQIRGFHPDIVILDDLETDEIVANPRLLKKLEDWFWTDVWGMSARQYIVIGTLLHNESFLARLVHNPPEGFKSKFYQAIKPDGTSLWPGKWPISLLEQKRKEMGVHAFEQEFMNNPVPDDLRKFQKQWIKYFDKEPDNCLYFTAVDPAIETKDVNDYTAIVTIGMDSDSNIFVVEAINKRMLPSETIATIFDVHKRWKPQMIGIECVGFQKMLKQEIDKQKRERNVYPLIRELKSEGRRKTLRIEAMQPRFEAGKVFIKRSMSELETQLLRFPSPRCHDDLPDAMAYAMEMARPSSEQAIVVNPDSFIAEVQRRRQRNIIGRRGFYGNHKLRNI